MNEISNNIQTKRWIDIIIPTYNSEKWIKCCVDSLLILEKYINNVIVIDDCSSDSTVQILKDIENIYSFKIKIIRCLSNKGPSACRNIGINHSAGSHVLFVDSDDTLNISAELMIEKKDYDFTVGLHNQVKRNSLDLSISDYNLNKVGACRQNLEFGISKDQIFKYMINYLMLPREYCLFEHCWGKLYKRDILNKFNLRFEEKANQLEDVLFNLEYMEHIHSCYLVPKAVYNHTQNINANRLSLQAGQEEYTYKMIDRCAEKAKCLLLKNRDFAEHDFENLSFAYKASKLTGYFVRISLSNSFNKTLYTSLEAIREIYQRENLHKYINLRKDESSLLHFILRYRFFSTRAARKYLQIRFFAKLQINKIRDYLDFMIQHWRGEPWISAQK